MRSGFIDFFGKALILVSIPVMVSVWIPSHKLFVAGLLSLGIPIVVVLNCLNLIRLLLLRSKWIIGSICILAWASWVLANTVSFVNEEKPSSHSFSIVSYNVNKLYDSVHDAGYSNRDSFIQWLKEHDFDLVVTQEMVEHRDKPFMVEGYNKVFSGKITEEGDQLGLFIFSKFPIIKSGVLEFGINSFNRVLWVDILFNNTDTLRVIDAHLKSYDFQRDSLFANFVRLRDGLVGRSWHVELTKRLVQETPHPIVLCGDFNETAYTNNYRRIASLLTDAFLLSGRVHDHTYKLWRVPYRIDYIFKSKSLRSFYFRVHYEVPWSDHYPISARIGLPDPDGQKPQ